jgi:hypothetical protein
MKTIQQLIIALIFAVQAFSQTWVNTGPLNENWTCYSVGSSADGTKLAIIGEGVNNGQGSLAVIFTSTNSGAIWTLQTNTTIKNLLLSVASSFDGLKLVAAGSTNLCISTNLGVTWTFTSTVTNYWTCVASSADGSKLVAGAYPNQGNGEVGGIFTSTNSGTTWTLQTNAPIKNYWISVASSTDGNKLVALANTDTNGGLGGIYTSTNSGITWTQTSATTNSWDSVASSADGNKLVAAAWLSGFFPGNGGSIFTSTNAGAMWFSNNVPVTNWQAVASSADGTKLVAVTSFYGGQIYASTNSGNTWLQVTNFPSLSWESVAQSADGNEIVAATGYASRIYISQSIPAPEINIAPASGNFSLSWIIPSTNFVLQSSFDLSSWANVTNQPVLNLTNLQNQITLPLAGSNGFYRLKTP